MKFVLAPDKFKGSLTGKQFCDAVEKGIRKILPKAIIIKKPLADGGDGTLTVVKDYLDAAIIEVEVTGPMFKMVKATYLYAEEQRTAYIEMSEASGYRLLKKEDHNCVDTTTLGTGELLLDALDRGAEQLILGIGGSATNDGGMGVAVALGYKFLDSRGKELSPTGAHLENVAKIDTKDIDPRLAQVTVKVACDVENPFYGPQGAAYIYAPQKGASQEEVLRLDKGLAHFASIVAAHFNTDLQKIPGAGAAGGLGGGAAAFLNASLVSGNTLIKDIAGFDAAITDADWIITGEGKLDDQTLSGKTIAGVLSAAKQQEVPVAALCGLVTLAKDTLKKSGISYAVGVSEGISDIAIAYRDAGINLEHAASEFAKAIAR